MSCYHPLTAYRAPPGSAFPGLTDSLRGRKISFDRRYANLPGVEQIALPCGKCIGCRLDYSKQWAIRICHEQYFADKSCFVTLTYDEQHLPADRSLVKKDLQDFFKRLRYHYPESEIRYFACGEYGSKTFRPHYHVALFGEDFSSDRKFYKFSGVQRNALYTSQKLAAQVWQRGYAPVGSLTFDSAAYVARYILKKVTGDIAEDYYKGRCPEFVVMSRRPGLGQQWFEHFGDRTMELDSVLMKNGLRAKPPRYYEKLFSREHKLELLDIKERRIEYVLAQQGRGEYTPERLAAKENVTRYVIDNFLRRHIENVE